MKQYVDTCKKRIDYLYFHAANININMFYFQGVHNCKRMDLKVITNQCYRILLKTKYNKQD